MAAHLEQSYQIIISRCFKDYSKRYTESPESCMLHKKEAQLK